jgi:signal peptidase II
MNISKSFSKKIIFKEIIMCLVIVIFIFILDRISKIKIINSQLNSSSTFINEYLNFDLVWNTGISFGLFSQNANIYYHAISFIIFLVIVFLSYLISRAVFLDKILFSLILGGALGNFFDRIY